MTYEEASGFSKTSQTDFGYDEAMCVTMPDPTIGKLRLKKGFSSIFKYIVVHYCVFMRYLRCS